MIKENKSHSFKVVVLGCLGGPKEISLSGYLVAIQGTNQFLCVDAGSLLAGIEKALEKKSFSSFEIKEDPTLLMSSVILQKQIKAYLISHAHLDHIVGLIINSQADSCKPIYGLPSTIDNIRDHILNWEIWPNLTNEGKKPQLFQYTYQRLTDGKKTPIPDLEMNVEAYPLSHSGEYKSTAFLIEGNSDYLLYIGDTAPDALEEKKLLHTLWERVAPLLLTKRLKGIFVECSFPDSRLNADLHGHLKSSFLLQELNNLGRLAFPDDAAKALDGLTIVVTHIKGSMVKGEDTRKRIEKELEAHNDLGVRFHFPEQGEVIAF